MYSIWNCYYTDCNGIRSMNPIRGKDANEASIKFQLLAPNSKLTRIAPDLRSANGRDPYAVQS